MILLLQEETALIEGLQNGDSRSFRILVETYQNRVYNTTLGFLQHAEDAEDLTQEIFVQVHQSIHRFKGESKLSTWIYRIVVSRSLDVLRSRKAKKRFAILRSLFGSENELKYDSPDFDHPGIVLQKKEQATMLFHAIHQLPDQQKSAFILHKLEGQSYKEIAEILGISLSAVESLLFRAKNNLRTIIKTYYSELL